MYVAALAGLRLTCRRTLAQWTSIGFAAAVAIGALVGRTAIAGSQSLFGVAGLAATLAGHWPVSAGRCSAPIAKLTDRRVLVERGRLGERGLHVCGITRNDLFPIAPAGRLPP